MKPHIIVFDFLKFFRILILLSLFIDEIFLKNTKPLWRCAPVNGIFMVFFNILYKVRTRSFIEKVTGKDKITEHLVPIQTIITQILYKSSTKRTSNSKQNAKKHRNTKTQKDEKLVFQNNK